MNSTGSATDSTPPLAEMLVRILRHEVGDLLQTIYSAAAILQERLPADQSLEQRVIAGLRGRAEVCKYALDAVHDWVCPLTLNTETLRFHDLLGALVVRVAARFPHVKVRSDIAPLLPFIAGDAQRLTHVAELLIHGCCAAASECVECRLAADGSTGVIWTVTHDGAGQPVEQVDGVFTPFPAGRYNVVGLGLAVAQKIIQLHGGQVEARDRPQGGLEIRLVLPGACG